MEKNNNSKIDDFNFFQISGFMVNKLKLRGNALMVYAIIYGFSQDGESYFTGSRKYLCDFTGSSKPTVDKALEELICSGLIIKESEKKNDIIYNRFKINKDKIGFTPSKESLPPCKETLPNNIDNNIDNTKEISIINNTKEKSSFLEGYDENGEYHSFFENDDNFKEIPKPEEKPKTDVEKVFEYYVMKSKFYGYVKKNLKMSNITLNNITKYLKEYSITYIEQTIDRYFQVITDKNYFFNTYWFPEKFFKQGNAFKDFTEEGNKWINYNLARNKVNPYKS